MEAGPRVVHLAAGRFAMKHPAFSDGVRSHRDGTHTLYPAHTREWPRRFNKGKTTRASGPQYQHQRKRLAPMLAGRGLNSGFGSTSKKQMISRHDSHRNERVPLAVIGLAQVGQAGGMVGDRSEMAGLTMTRLSFDSVRAPGYVPQTSQPRSRSNALAPAHSWQSNARRAGEFQAAGA
jgi:hypothetical protein